MKKEIENYIRYTERDAGLANKKFDRCITVMAAKPSGRLNPQQAAALTKRLTTRMHKLAARHRAALSLPEPHHINELGEKDLYRRAPPVVFGIITMNTKVIFFSLDASITDGRQPNVLTQFDFSKLGADVWNGIAIALLCINARNATHEHIEELEDLKGEAMDIDA